MGTCYVEKRSGKIPFRWAEALALCSLDLIVVCAAQIRDFEMEWKALRKFATRLHTFSHLFSALLFLLCFQVFMSPFLFQSTFFRCNDESAVKMILHIYRVINSCSTLPLAALISMITHKDTLSKCSRSEVVKATVNLFTFWAFFNVALAWHQPKRHSKLHRW